MKEKKLTPNHWEPQFRELPWQEFYRTPLSQRCEWSVSFRGEVTGQSLRKAIQMLELSLEYWEADEKDRRIKDFAFGISFATPLPIAF